MLEELPRKKLYCSLNTKLNIQNMYFCLNFVDHVLKNLYLIPKCQYFLTESNNMISIFFPDKLNHGRGGYEIQSMGS